MDYLNLTFLVGNLVGSLFKRKDGFNNKFIPGVVLGTQLLVNGLLAGLGIDINTYIPPVVAPPMPEVVGFGADMGSVALHAGFFSMFGGLMVKSVMDTLIAIGVHSARKNSLQV